MSHTQLPWYCAACEGTGRGHTTTSTVGEEQYFLRGNGHVCPRCGSEDVFEDEIFEGSDCNESISNDLFTKKDLNNPSLIVGAGCPNCPRHVDCKLQLRPLRRKINWPPAP